MLVIAFGVMSYYGRRSRPDIIGSLSGADYAAIVLAINEDARVRYKDILVIEVKSHSAVEVRVGIERGPLDGSGQDLLLHKENGAWIVEAIVDWIG